MARLCLRRRAGSLSLWCAIFTVLSLILFTGQPMLIYGQAAQAPLGVMTSETVAPGQTVTLSLQTSPSPLTVTVVNWSDHPIAATLAARAQVSFDGSLTLTAPPGFSIHIIEGEEGHRLTIGAGCRQSLNSAATLSCFVTPGARVTIQSEPWLTVAYSAGWNLIAGPAGTVPRGTEGPLYTLTPTGDRYQTLPAGTPLEAGRSYWAYFTTRTIQVLSSDRRQSFTQALPAGHFVMIGNPFRTAALVQGADVVYGYDSNEGYYPTTLLPPGAGAWALSFTGGIITIQPAPP
jgi:hypothetical protein